MTATDNTFCLSFISNLSLISVNASFFVGRYIYFFGGSAKTSQRSSPIMHRFKAKLVDPYMCVKARIAQMFTNRISSSAFACTFSHHRNIVCLNPLQKLVGRYTYCHKNYKMDARTICSMVTIHLPNSFLRYLCIHSHIDNSCNLYIWVHSTVQVKSDSATQIIVLALL